jgi:small subunit ribosomal protein S6
MSELRPYEITFIAEPNFDDERVNAMISKYSEFVEKQGGQVSKVERMGKKRLAYLIEKRQYGYYVYTETMLPGEAIGQLKRWFALSEDVFRHLVVRMTERDMRKKALTQDRYRKEMDRRNAATRPAGKDENSEEQEAKNGQLSS